MQFYLIFLSEVKALSQSVIFVVDDQHKEK